MSHTQFAQPDFYRVFLSCYPPYGLDLVVSGGWFCYCFVRRIPCLVDVLVSIHLRSIKMFGSSCRSIDYKRISLALLLSSPCVFVHYVSASSLFLASVLLIEVFVRWLSSSLILKRIVCTVTCAC